MGWLKTQEEIARAEAKSIVRGLRKDLIVETAHEMSKALFVAIKRDNLNALEIAVILDTLTDATGRKLGITEIIKAVRET